MQTGAPQRGQTTASAAATANPQNASVGFSAADLPVLLAVLAATVFVLFKTVQWHSLPAEDSLMLLRYAQHLAAGQGIVWNIGERPVEGATDFFFLVVLAGWMKLTHLHPILGVRTLLAIFQAAGTGLLYWASRTIAGTGRLVAAVLAIYLGLGPGITHVSNGFSCPFFGFVALVAWCFANESMLRGVTGSRSLGFAVSALVLGLTRPDGVFLAAFMAAAVACVLGRKSVPLLLTFAGVFLVLGGAYFLWRLHYFGFLLPNPYYRKGGGHLYLDSLRISANNTLRLLMPFGPVYLAGLFYARTRRLTVAALVPIVGFACIWIMLTNENNASMRFQYVVLPVGLLSVAVLAQKFKQQLEALGPAFARLRLATPAACALAVALAVFIQMWWRAAVPGPQLIGTGAYEIAKGLSIYKDRGYTIVATEAGVIPYFSQWRAIDTMGLNDTEIIHNPEGVTVDYLDQQHPAIIMMFSSPFRGMADFGRVWRGDPPTGKKFLDLNSVASHYAVTHGYVLAARWGVTACEVNIWYVRADLPEAAEMLRIIRHEPHFYPYGGGLAHNYLTEAPPATCDDSATVLTSRD